MLDVVAKENLNILSTKNLQGSNLRTLSNS